MGEDRSKYKQLEITIFKGDHPDLRPYRAEHYFNIRELTKEKKLKVDVLVLYLCLVFIFLLKI